MANPRSAAPITRTERSLAPDIARGGMLLFIAIANVGFYLWGGAVDDYGHFADSSTADRIGLFFEQLLMANRTRPMFALLYGFGMAVMASRMFARGMDAKGARKVLRRRSWGLIALGCLHGMLLFQGDIVAVYGATGLIALGLVHLSDRALRRWLWGTLAYMVVIAVPGSLFLTEILGGGNSSETAESTTSSNYLSQILDGVVTVATGSVAAMLTLIHIPLVIIGIMLRRAGWIDRPGNHLTGLRRVFISGMAVNLTSSLPVALIALGAWHPGQGTVTAAAVLASFGGLYAGLGYICGLALVAHRWQSHGRRGVPGALAALGERSLSGYLGQSILMAPLLSAWGFAFGDDLGYLSAYGIAFGAWLVTLTVAVLLDRSGKRGPFEVALRRLTYGRKQVTTSSAPSAANPGTVS